MYLLCWEEGWITSKKKNMQLTGVLNILKNLEIRLSVLLGMSTGDIYIGMSLRLERSINFDRPVEILELLMLKW